MEKNPGAPVFIKTIRDVDYMFEAGEQGIADLWSAAASRRTP